MKPIVVVTGGAGFIGSHTVLALDAAGYRPVILDNYSTSEPGMLHRLADLLGYMPDFYELDCVDYAAGIEALEPLGPIHGIIHFAAFKSVPESAEVPLRYYHNNLGSTLTVLRWCRALNIPHLVFSSSCTVYGEPDQLPVTEQTPLLPASSVYGHTKQMCEHIITTSLAELPGLGATLLRYFNPIGAHPSGLLGELPLGRPNNLVPYLTQAAAGLRDPLMVYGTDYPTPDGSCIRDYIHVMDLAEAHVAALRHLADRPGSQHIFNLGTGQGASVLEVILTFEYATGVAVPHTLGPRRTGDVAAIYADVHKAVTELGWQSRYTLAEALLHAWQWQLQLQKNA